MSPQGLDLKVHFKIKLSEWVFTYLLIYWQFDCELGSSQSNFPPDNPAGLTQRIYYSDYVTDVYSSNSPTLIFSIIVSPFFIF